MGGHAIVAVATHVREPRAIYAPTDLTNLDEEKSCVWSSHSTSHHHLHGMTIFQDPTPCPQPRRTALTKSRGSLVGLNEPSTSLPGAPRPPGLHDGKPRRPKQRMSIGWDPTVDIYDDTFALKDPVVEAPVAQNTSTSSEEASQPELNKKPRRHSTLFAQPAQRAQFQNDQRPGNAASPRKRRLSSVVGQETQNPERQDMRAVTAGHDSVLRKEARRRTIYVPNDTTVFTIHPGASLQNQVSKRSKPRKSDVFLDLATLTEDKLETTRPAESDQAALPRRRGARESLTAAPRRAPLQVSQRQLQPQASSVDVVGKGGGKENVPPGGNAMPKRLGKRASLILPEKSSQKPFSSLAPVGEEAEFNVNAQSSVRGSSLAAENESADHFKPTDRPIEAQRQYTLRNSTSARLTLNANVTGRKGSLPSRSVNVPQVEASQSPPTAPVAPNINLKQTKPAQKYVAIPEDIAHPELYEENWLSHQEQGISQLVNSLFDKAHVTKAASPNSFPFRQKLLNIYHNSENVLLHKRLRASLRFGALSIPPETLAQVARFKDDCGQRQRFLDLWLKTYNLEALQVAAEVVVGRRRVSSPRNCGSGSSQGMSPKSQSGKSTMKFLQTFLVQNLDLANRQSINVTGLSSPGASLASRGSSPNAAQIWQRTALRSLMLINLLDTAQRQGLFPCQNLFQTSSPYKSSLAVVQGLCRLLIPSVGDVPRVLGHLGFHVSHTQYPLEEFSYHISNLAVDLRDGVRLTRLVECLLYPPGSLDLHRDGLTVTLASGDVLTSSTNYNGDQGATWPLSQHLKYPCTGRVQRMYNVEIALAALGSITDVDNGMLRGLSATDIVDGHREKTVRLLWGLVSKWGLGMLVDFDLVDRETKRLRHMQARKLGRTTCDEEVAEVTCSKESERQTRLLREWAQLVCALHDVAVTNLTTSFADGQAYKAIGHEYTAIIPASTSCPKSKGETSGDLPSILSAFGCSKSFTSLFLSPRTSPSKTTTTSLLAFLASRILPVATPHNAALCIQRAYRAHLARWETRRRVALKCLAEECVEVVAARERLTTAVTTLQAWWRECVNKRRRGARRWV